MKGSEPVSDPTIQNAGQPTEGRKERTGAVRTSPALTVRFPIALSGFLSLCPSPYFCVESRLSISRIWGHQIPGSLVERSVALLTRCGGRWSEAQQKSTTPAAVERAIAQAQASGTLNLTSRDLFEVPPNLFSWNAEGQSDKWWEVVQLAKLDLSHNELRHLPEELFEALDSLQVAPLATCKQTPSVLLPRNRVLQELSGRPHRLMGGSFNWENIEGPGGSLGSLQPPPRPFRCCHPS